MTSSALKLYLAGPEVFLPDARAILDSKAALTGTTASIPSAPAISPFRRRRPNISSG